MNKSLSVSILVFFIGYFAHAQEIDVVHYEHSITLSDNTDEIVGQSVLKIAFSKVTGDFSLDLIQPKGGKGMKVSRVVSTVRIHDFRQEDDKLKIRMGWPAVPKDTLEFYIHYRGVPADGLIISKNKYGERTFFADNWPNRARHWMPCNDRPDDKATVDFYVAVPRYYQVVSNGVVVNDTASGEWQENARSNGTYYHWREEVPIPTKVMVIGAARFAVKEFEDSPAGIPVSAWVYPQDSTKGFYDYALAVPILKYFEDYIGDYPFKKLANVQSKTIFGGMENAGCIFYSESSVTGKRSAEALIAHEVAHQWFGNSATEKHFSHLWLSEGFATHMTNVYLEHKYGKDTVLKRLQADRKKVIDFLGSNPLPVVDSSSRLMALLNANSYQKGGWVLRMIHAEVGDWVFQQIIRKYYNDFKSGNAETRDFQKVVEAITGKSWDTFFDQWLYRDDVPYIRLSWSQKGNKLNMDFWQSTNFSVPLEYRIVMEDGTSRVRTVSDFQTVTVTTTVTGKVKEIILDPNVKLLADFHFLTAKTERR